MGVFFFLCYPCPAGMDLELHFTSQVFESLANPLFVESYLDDTQLTDTSLLVSPIIRQKKYHKKVHWPDEDEDERQPLVELFTYFGNWDRTPIQVSVYPKNSYQAPEVPIKGSSWLFYLCIAFFVALLAILG